MEPTTCENCGARWMPCRCGKPVRIGSCAETHHVAVRCSVCSAVAEEECPVESTETEFDKEQAIKSMAERDELLRETSSG
jgi:hypothetical protein